MDSLDQTLSTLPLIQSLAVDRPAPVLVPAELSVAWNAIPVLAFRGFSRGVSQMKRDLEERFAEWEVDGDPYTLATENHGSRWPKVSLGALGDDQILSLDDAKRLRAVCDRFAPALRSVPPLIAEEMRAVVFECRSLERRLLAYPIPFADRYRTNTPPTVSYDDTIDQDHEDYVRWVLGGYTWARLTEYWRQGLATGKGTESRYRERHVEATLVIDLNGAYGDLLGEFIAAVDDELTAKYCWFEPSSRHVTVRNLNLEPLS